MSKKIFLVDMENVNFSGVDGYEKLKRGDEIHLFVGACTDKIKIPFLSFVQDNGVITKFYTSEVNGKNALDFQLTSFLGFCVGTCYPGSELYIVSRDKGFDNSIRFWRKYSIRPELTISRISSIKDVFCLEGVTMPAMLMPALEIKEKKVKREKIKIEEENEEEKKIDNIKKQNATLIPKPVSISKKEKESKKMLVVEPNIMYPSSIKNTQKRAIRSIYFKTLDAPFCKEGKRLLKETLHKGMGAIGDVTYSLNCETYYKVFEEYRKAIGVV